MWAKGCEPGSWPSLGRTAALPARAARERVWVHVCGAGVVWNPCLRARTLGQCRQRALVGLPPANTTHLVLNTLCTCVTVAHPSTTRNTLNAVKAAVAADPSKWTNFYVNLMVRPLVQTASPLSIISIFV